MLFQCNSCRKHDHILSMLLLSSRPYKSGNKTLVLVAAVQFGTILKNGAVAPSGTIQKVGAVAQSGTIQGTGMVAQPGMIQGVGAHSQPAKANDVGKTLSFLMITRSLIA